MRAQVNGTELFFDVVGAQLAPVGDSMHGALVGPNWDAFGITVEQVMELAAD